MNELEDALIKFFAHIENYDSVDECWIWKTLKNKGSYVRFQGVMSHRWIWSYLHGPVPSKNHLHHTCRNKRCVNPVHLRSLSISAHRVRHWEDGDVSNWNSVKTHCKRGHELSKENIYGYKNRRVCKLCRKQVYLEGKQNG